MTIKELKAEEFDRAIGLLQEANLQYSDLDQPHIRLFGFEEEGQLVGIGGLEIFGDLALLRSVAVKKDCRGRGLGAKIVGQLERLSKESGITALFLLTNTAKDFFLTRGYQQFDRDDFPETLKQTAQFSGLCPVSAVCMKKAL
jgi:amino-acid N-acetyltransferase